MSLNACTLSKHGREVSSAPGAPYNIGEVCYSALQQPLVMGLWAEMQNTFESITFEASSERIGSWYFIAREGDKFTVEVSKDNQRDAQYGVIASLFVLAVDYLKMKGATSTGRLNDFAPSGAQALAALFYNDRHIAAYKRTFINRVAMLFPVNGITEETVVHELMKLTPINNLLASIRDNCKGEKVLFAISDIPEPTLELKIKNRKCEIVFLKFPHKQKLDVKEFAQLVLNKLIAWSFIIYNKDCDEPTLTPITALNPIRLIMKSQDVQSELEKELEFPSQLLYFLLDA